MRQKLNFTKMHGAGNDFILIEDFSGAWAGQYSDLARQVCSRHTGIGADGLMILGKPQYGGDWAMGFYNSDGSLGEMCGNGARCICRYGHDHGLAGEEQHVETTAGLVTGWRIAEDRYRIRLNDPSVLDEGRIATGPDGETETFYVELGHPGIPHAVVLLPGWNQIPQNRLREVGRMLRHSLAFPKGANVTFAEKIKNNRIRAITFERGVEDFTLACGTGCGATAIAFVWKGLCSEKNILIEMPGGILSVDMTFSGSNVKDLFLSGPAEVICEGTCLVNL